MRHRKFSQRLSRPLGHRKATVRNLVISLIRHQRIKTTKAKAQQVRSCLEHLITLGRQNNLPSRRLALKILGNKDATGELFSRIAPLFKQRKSGFSRIIHLSSRRGDGAQLVFLELTEKLPKAKPAKPAKAEAKKTPKPSEKPEQKLSPPKSKPKPPKELKPKKFLGGLRRLFKKERDAL